MPKPCKKKNSNFALRCSARRGRRAHLVELWPRASLEGDTRFQVATPRTMLGEKSSPAEGLKKELQKHLEHDEQARSPRVAPDSVHGARDARGIEFVVEGREALPEVVKTRIENMEDQMYSGFLSELNLAWVSVDDTICLWLPRQPQDTYFDPNPYDGPRPPPCSKTCKDYVFAVTLVKPDPNKEYDCDGMPPYFLAVALRECVQLFKLEVTDREISVQDTAIEIPVESFIKCMVATPRGRLFVGCNDGYVYELHYEEDDLSLSSFWRPRKFRKTACNTYGSRVMRGLKSLVQYHETEPVVDMCFDPTRHFLYALTAKNSDQRTSLAKDYIAKNTTLHVYSLSSSDSDGGMGKPENLDSKTLEALEVSKCASNVLDKDVLSIHPVVYSESVFFPQPLYNRYMREDSQLHVVLVTASGWRIYFRYDSHSKLHWKKEDVIPPPWHTKDMQNMPHSQSTYAPGTSRARCAMYKNGLFLLGNDTGVHCRVRKWEGDFLGGQRACTQETGHLFGARTRITYTKPADNTTGCCAGDNQHSHEVAQEIKASQLSQDQYGASLDLWTIEEMTTRGIVGMVRDIWGKSRPFLTRPWCQVPSVNEQWTQHVSPPRRFICIGRREVVILHRLQPWEKLRELAKEQEVRRGQLLDQPDDTAMAPEQKCASLLLWWVRAGGSPGSQADHASKFLFRFANHHEVRVSAAEIVCMRVRVWFAESPA